MPTANELVRDGLTRHQVRILRFARALERELQELANRPNARLRDRIEALLRRFPLSGFRARSAERLIAEFERRIRDLHDPLEREMRTLLRARLLELAVREVDFTERLVLGSLPVLHDFNRPNRRELRTLVRVVPHDGLPLAGWVSRTWEGDRQRIVAEVRTGLLFSESRAEILRRVFGRRSLQGADGIRNVTFNAIASLAGTLVNSVSNQARGRFYQANPVIQTELFVATLDRRTTAICRATDGEIFPVGEGRIPPLHRRCRSLRVPVIDGERLGTRPANAATERELRGLRGPERRAAAARMVGRVPETQTYDQFLRNQSVAFQNEALGVTKAKLYRKGGLSLDRFVDPTGRELTLPELYDLERGAFERAGIPPP